MDVGLKIQLLEEDAHKFRRAKEVHGRRMTATVDMKLVKRWLALCKRAHGDACESVWWRGNGDDALPPFVRMLDVMQMSLIQAPSDCCYVALSYVWGTAGDSYWTTKANMDSRTKPAGLDLSVLPATIVDAVHVTRALGERYLWVDALCIIQDSSDDKGNQIRAMELIYSGAFLTIVAAGGESAHARLPGLSMGSRTLHQHIEVIQDLHLTTPLLSLREASMQSAWATRGWTYQELVISRRRLFFTNQQVYFECAKDIWCEDLVAESKTLRYSDHPMRYSGSGVGLIMRHPPVFRQDRTSTYIRVVEQYTQRRLSYPSDIILAVTAITNAMTEGYQLGGGNPDQAFQYGMQIRDLNLSLLWQPRLDSAQARRMSSDKGPSTWPSWTWAGWTGAVFYSDATQLTTTFSTTSTQVEPAESLVRAWYLVDDDQQLVHLDVEPIRFCPIGNPEEMPRPRYMFPVDTTDERLPDPMPPVGTLVFRTECAFLRVSKLETTSSDAESLPHTIFDIRSDIRQPSVGVGRMILPSTTPSPSVLECIVLSRHGGMLGLYDDAVYGDVYQGCTLHVMAVKRGGEHTQVRERVGLGVIHEQAWLECDTKVETVFLG